MSQTQTGNELDRRRHLPNQVNQVQITNNEPNSTLYIFAPDTNAKSNPQQPMLLQSGNPQVQVYVPKPVQIQKDKNIPVKTVKTAETAPKTQTSQSGGKKQSPVKHLAGKFRKSGLGVIDSYFNALYLYYGWKSDRTERKTRDYLETIARHPRGWGKDKSNADVYEKNSYDKYLAFLAFLARIWGFICSLFKPLSNFFKSAMNFFATFANASKASKNMAYIAQKAFAFLLPVFSVIFTIVTIQNIYSFKPEYELTFNGQNIGFVDSKETVGKVISLIEHDVSSVLNEQYEFTGDLSYRIVLAKNKTYVSESNLYRIINNSSQIQGAITTAYGLFIDGELIGAAQSASDINIVLNEILEANAGDIDDGTIEFANDITIIENKYAKRDVVSPDELKDIITYLPDTAAADTETAYGEGTKTMQSGSDTDSDSSLDSGSDSEYSDSEYININEDAEIPMADGHSLFSESLKDSQYSQDSDDAAARAEDIAAIAAASSIDLTPEAINTIPRGFLKSDENNQQDAVLSRLSKTSGSTTAGSILFKKTKLETYTEEVPFEVKYVDSNLYSAGTQTVQTNGVNGVNMITADVTYIGEEEVSREIKEIESIKNPVNKVVLVGTKVKPVAAPTGGFIRPVSGGYISCYYSGGHRAIDIPRPTGTKVTASDGGTVIYAGYHSSYGNNVKIRHSNGFVTLYAHLSSFSVSYGDKVFQGQEIGKVGSTGYSTGSHLHFEIIKNGVQLNPLDYINK